MDDEPARHHYLARRWKGHHLVHTYSVAQALGVLQESPVFDLALLDYHLGPQTPGGLDFARALVAPEFPLERRPRGVVIHSHDIFGADRMLQVLLAAGVLAIAEPLFYV